MQYKLHARHNLFAAIVGWPANYIVVLVERNSVQYYKEASSEWLGVVQ